MILILITSYWKKNQMKITYYVACKTPYVAKPLCIIIDKVD